MNDSRNLAIGLLSSTAVMLLVGLVIVQSRPAPVQADGMSLLAGDYVLTVGNVDQTDEEMLYVIDNGEAKMIAYRFDGIRGQIEMVDGVDLNEIRKNSEGQPQGSSQPGGQRRP